MTSAPAVPPPTQPSQSAASRTTTTAGPPVIGDGTTTGTRIRTRWQRFRLPVAIGVVLLVAAALAGLLTPRTSAVPLAPDNPEPSGSRALAEILRDQGVETSYVRLSADAVEQASSGTTLLVTTTHLLTDEQVDALAATGADIVLASPTWPAVSMLTDDRLDTTFSGGSGAVPPQCDDPDAQAAEEIRSEGTGLLALDDDVTICFPSDPADPQVGAYAVVDLDERRVVAFDDSTLMTNDRLDEDGNAALMLRALGRHEQLIWYVPTAGDLGEQSPEESGATLPDWAGPLAAQLVLVVVVLALWRGRRLGRIVTEPLPVTVRAAETTRGRGRLYRRSRSRGHAGAALRAGTARRAAQRLGLPRSAGAPEVIEALARATGRSTEQVAGLLYGPPPTDDAGLLELARQLDELESEVHRT